MAKTPEATSSSGLVVSDLRKDFPTPGEPLRVLRGVDLRLMPGESLAVVGPSGSGKSTLLNIIAALEEPTDGKVRLNEVDPFTLSTKALATFRGRQVGFVFQDHHLLPQCTALENLLVAPLAVGAVTQADQQRATDLLERVGLGDRAGHLPNELSGGERQRVALARAMMNGPTLLLCDEPTGNLDRRAADAVTDLLLSLTRQEQTIVLLATHDATLAAQLERRQRLDNGLLVDA